LLTGARRGRAKASIQLRLRLVETRIRCEPSEDSDWRAFAPLEHARVEAKRRPQSAIDRESKACGHHADERVCRVGQADGAPDDIRIRVEAGAPQILTDDDDGRRASLLVAILERAAVQRRPGNDAERGRADLDASDGLDAAVLGDQVLFDLSGGPKLLDGRELTFPRGELEQRRCSMSALTRS
jgi:hypothetical protein